MLIYLLFSVLTTQIDGGGRSEEGVLRPFHDLLDRKKQPRMPWQDIHCCVNGPAARDVSLNFIQRWNEHRATLRLRPLPIWPTIHTTTWDFPHGWDGARCQVLRSLSGWSGHSTEEASIYYAMLAAIEHAKHYVCVVARARAPVPTAVRKQQRLSPAARRLRPRGPPHCRFAPEALRSPLSASPTSLSSHSFVCSIFVCSIFCLLYSFVLSLRRYIESQFFISSPHKTKSVAVNLLAQKLAERLERAFVWEKEFGEPSKFRVAFVLPFHADGMLAESETVTKVILHHTQRSVARGDAKMNVNGSVIGILRANARARIEAESAKEGGGNSAWIAHDEKLLEENFSAHIRFFGLYRWEKMPSTEGGVPLYVTSQIYVHTKLLLVDDAIMILGSANCNDRSMLGTRCVARFFFSFFFSFFFFSCRLRLLTYHSWLKT